MDTVLIHFDGASRGNPGPAGAGALLEDESGAVLAELSSYLGEQTNNYAEYQGLLLALRKVRSLGARRLKIQADSELVVRQIEGRYKVKAPHLIPLFIEARKLLQGFEQVSLAHVPRGHNAAADRLANLAIDQAFARR